jgi:hypothetical protein
MALEWKIGICSEYLTTIWNILSPFVHFLCLLIYLFYPVLVCCTKNNLATQCTTPRLQKSLNELAEKSKSMFYAFCSNGFPRAQKKSICKLVFRPEVSR